jgi:transposase-like protein
VVYGATHDVLLDDIVEFRTGLTSFWLSVLTKLRNRGPRDILICCCDGLSGLPEAIKRPD